MLSKSLALLENRERRDNVFRLVRRRAVALIATIGLVLVGVITSSLPAQADPEAYFNFYKNVDQVLLGQPVPIGQITACPSGVHQLRAVVVDSNNTQFNLNLEPTDASGNWDDTWVYIPEDAALGTGSMHVECILGVTVDQTTEPHALDILEQNWAMGMDKAHLWGTATFNDSLSSGLGACPANAQGELFISGPPSTGDGNPTYTIDSTTFTADALGRFTASIYIDPDLYLVGQDYYATYYCHDTVNEYWDLIGYHFSPGADEYVALGDSYSSGEGSFNYNLTGIGPDCHNSTDGYPHIIAEELNLGLPNFPACSGSVTDDLWNSSSTLDTSQGQMDELTEDTKVVTLTIGGNDAGFESVLSACTDWALIIGYGCSTGTNVTVPLSNRMSALAGTYGSTLNAPGTLQPIHSIADTLRAITTAAPNAVVYIAGYPKLFGSSVGNFSANALAPSGYVCDISDSPPATIRMDYGDAQWLNAQATVLNTIISDTVTDLSENEGLGVMYISPSRFNGHGLCDSGARWLNGVSVTAGVADPESFHPNTTGMSSGYARQFEYWIGPHD